MISRIRALSGFGIKAIHLGSSVRKYYITKPSLSEYFSPVPPGSPQSTIYETIMSGTPQTLNQILETKSIDVNLRFEKLRNFTPLMLAAEFNKTAMMQVLIDQGAKLNLQDDFGNTALMVAAREQCKDAIQVLIDAGAQVDIVNSDQMTAADSTMDVDLDEKLRNEGSTEHVGPIIGGDVKG